MGNMIIVQESTQTFISELQVNQVFGQISFFSGRPRTVTVKSRGFSELMYLDQMMFLKSIYTKHSHAVKVYEDLRYKLIENPKNFTPLYLKCYHCQLKGHIAIDCDFYQHIKGNLTNQNDMRFTQDENHKQEI